MSTSPPSTVASRRAGKTALNLIEHLRHLDALEVKSRVPWRLRCRECQGTGELTPLRAEWDLLPPNCTECGGSGRDAVPWSELFMCGRNFMRDPTPDFFPTKKRHPNKKARKKAVIALGK